MSTKESIVSTENEQTDKSDYDPALAQPTPEAPIDDDDDDLPPLEEGSNSYLDADDVSEEVAKLELNKKQDVFKIDYRHQEIDRILLELEANYEAVIQASGGWESWMPAEGLAMFLMQQLGYEDDEQFEDALGGTFDQFVDALPHFESKVNDEEGSTKGMKLIRMTKPEGGGRGVTKTLTVSKSADLWRILFKSPRGTISIPKLEFEMGASQKRQIDGVYNYISTAIFNLTQHATQGYCSQEDAKKILHTVEELSNLLDIQEPWEFVVTDPTGMSFFDPEDDDAVKLDWHPEKEPDMATISEVEVPEETDTANR